MKFILVAAFDVLLCAVAPVKLIISNKLSTLCSESVWIIFPRRVFLRHIYQFPMPEKMESSFMSCCCPSEVISLQFIHKKIWFWGSLGNPQTFSMNGFCLLGGMGG